MRGDSESKKIVVLGAGVTGLTIAEQLSEKYADRVVVLEKEDFIGGMAVTYAKDGFSYDSGSHRLFPDSNQQVNSYIQNVLGIKLIKRQRHGKLVYHDRFIKYPPTMLNLLRCFTGKEMTSFAAGFLKEKFTPSLCAANDFESTMVRAVGKPFYNAFFKNYATKLWGMNPNRISAEAKRKRTIFSFKMLLNSIFSQKRSYLYPEEGMGSIAESMKNRLCSNGAKIQKLINLKSITTQDGKVTKLCFTDRHQQQQILEVSELVSTIRIDDLYATACPQDVRLELSWRGVRMVHMLIDQKLKNNCETYYCPDTAMRIGRISEINKYSPFLNSSLPGSFLTLEIPSSPGEDIWAVEDAALLEDCLKELTRIKITPKKALALKAFYTRLDKTYPIYLLGWKKDFDHIYSKLNRIENLYTLGRNGLFLHCNIDHCIEQGMALAEHILSGLKKDRKHWNARAKDFLTASARD